MAIHSLADPNNQKQGSKYPDLRNKARMDYEIEERERQEREEMASMFDEISVDTRVLAARYDRVSASLNKKIEDFDILKAIFSPKQTKKFPINKRYKALLRKTEGLLKSLNKEGLNDSEKRLKSFLAKMLPETERMAKLTETDETLV